MSVLSFVTTVLAIGAGLTFALPAAAANDLKVTKSFAGTNSKDKAKDLSGIACVPLEGGAYRCLVVDDENQTAQFAMIKDDEIKAGAQIRLIGPKADNDTYGTPPKTCSKKKKLEFDELDGEGVAYTNNYFYVVGSHSCSGRKGKFRLSTFILARIHVDSEGRPIDGASKILADRDMSKAVETTYRLSKLLRRTETIGAYFGKKLDCAGDNDKKGCGLNIEGIAVQDDNLYLGLRAPNLDGEAFIIRTKVSELFASGHERASKAARLKLIPVALGSNVGIRDLAALPDGRLLILTGSASSKPNRPYSIFVLDPSDGRLKQLLKDQKPPRAEAIAVLSTSPDLKLLVLFDGKLNGAPQELHIDFP